MVKARVRIVVALLVVGLLGGIGILVGRVMWQQDKSALIALGAELVPEVAQRLQDFHRVHVRDGRKEWEIAATDAQYFEDEQRIVVRELTLRFYLEDGRTVGVSGDEGMVSLDGRELRSVELRDGIEVTLPDYIVHTEYARYDRAANAIVAPGEVTISGRDVEARGKNMVVEIGTQRLRLSRDVHMTLRPREKAGRAAS